MSLANILGVIVNNPLEYSLSLLNLIGQSPKSDKTTFVKCFTVSQVTLSLFLILLIFWQFVQSEKSVDLTATSFSTFLSVYQLVLASVEVTCDGLYILLTSSITFSLTTFQLLLKLSLLNYKYNNFNRLLDNFETFWSFDELNEQYVQETSDILFLNKIIVTIFRNGGTLHLLSFFLTPVFLETRELPLPCWLPEQTPFSVYMSCYFLQSILLLTLFVIVVGFDALYATVCSEVAVQYKILCYHLERIGDGGDLEGLKKKTSTCIEHHQLLNSCCDEIQEIYSFLLLNQYAMGILTLCMELYITSASWTTTAVKTSAFLYSASMLTQLGTYCIFSTLLTTESNNVAGAVYNCGWYSVKDRSFHANVQFVMMKSQRAIVLNGCGVVNINMQCYITVLNTAITYYTFMKNIRVE